MAAGFIKKKVPWNKKPTTPVGIDWSNPLSKGLVAAYYFIGKGEASTPIDSAKGFKTLSDVSGYSAIEYGVGGARWHTDQNVGFVIDAHDLSNGFTVLGRLNHDTGTQDQALLGHIDTDIRLQIWRDEFSTDRVGFYVDNSAGSASPVYSPNPVPSGFYTVGATTNATTSTSGTHSLYIDGKLENTGSGNLNNDFATSAIRIGAVGAGTGKRLDGSIQFVLLFNVPKSAQQIKELTDNPYQLLQPQTRYIPVGAAAASTDTGFIPVRVPRTRKPDAPVRVNKAHPLAKDLIAFVYFNESGKAIYNAVTGQLFDDGSEDIDGTLISRSVGSDGRSVTGASAHTGVLKLHPDITPDDYDNITVLHKVKYASNSVDHCLFMTGALIGNNSMMLWADTEGSTLRPGAYSQTALYGTSNSLPVDEWVVWGADYSVGTGPTAAIYINGAHDTTTTDLGNSSNGSSIAFHYLNRYALDRPTYGECSWIAVWAGDTALSAADHKSFYDNPYQILQSQIRYIPVGAAGAAPPVGGTVYTDNYYRFFLSMGEF